MATEVDVDVDVFYSVLADIARGPEVYEFVRDQAEKAADVLRRAAPTDTGRGRATIAVGVHMGPDGWYGTASWSESAYYLGILNTRDGSRRERWADRAAAQVRYV